MDCAEHLRHVRVAGERISDVAAKADLKAPVPSCPDYDLGSLLVHTGGFCRFAREAIEQRRPPEIDYSDIGTDPLAWHRGELERLLSTLESVDPEAQGWSWGHDQRLAFWFRRAAQELGVHRWDVENAAGTPHPIDPALAVDGIDELLIEFGVTHDDWPFTGAAEHFGGTGETIHLHATDIDALEEGAGEFSVRCEPDRFAVERTHHKGDVAARGTASDLLLFLWGRAGIERLEVFGDQRLLERWKDRVRI